MPPRPHRRPSSGGYPRGDETRFRIISTAIAIFGQKGFHRASTREIAAEAEVNPPALQYYFNSKLGLYRACVDLMTATILRRTQPLLAEGDKLLAESATATDLIEYYCRLQDSLIDSFQEPHEGLGVGRLIMWEHAALETSEARYLMRDRVELPLMRMFFCIVGRMLDRPADDPEIALHAFALSGLFRIFYVDAARTESLLNWNVTDPGNTPLLKVILREQSTMLLEALLRKR